VGIPRQLCASLPRNPESENLDEKVLEVMTEVFLRGTLTKNLPSSSPAKSSSVAAPKKSLEREELTSA
jgi:hypothetical protein